MRKFCLIDAKCNRSDSVVADCFLRTSYVLSDQDVYARLFIHSFIHDLFGFKFFMFPISRWNSAALQARNGRIEHASKFLGDIQDFTSCPQALRSDSEPF